MFVTFLGAALRILDGCWHRLEPGPKYDDSCDEDRCKRTNVVREGHAQIAAEGGSRVTTRMKIIKRLRPI